MGYKIGTTNDSNGHYFLASVTATQKFRVYSSYHGVKAGIGKGMDGGHIRCAIVIEHDSAGVLHDDGIRLYGRVMPSGGRNWLHVKTTSAPEDSVHVQLYLKEGDEVTRLNVDDPEDDDIILIENGIGGGDGSEGTKE